MDSIAKPMINLNKFYTYAYLRKDKTPYYIGKGQGNRIHSTNRIIKPPKDKSRRIYLKRNLTEEEAFKHEIYMIDVFGRKDLGTGILYNMTNGGEGASGFIHSEKTKIKMSEAKKGGTFSDEHRKKLSDAQKGKVLSEETRKKMSAANKGKVLSDKHRKKIGDANKGKVPSDEHRKKLSDANKGKTHSEEHKRKNSEAQKGHIVSEETRKKQSDAKKGTKWWNDGCGNVKLMRDCPGNGWKLGKRCII